MSTITFDKLAYVSQLEKSGVTRKQAEAQADALDVALRDTVATKHDIELVRRDMKELEQRLKYDLTIRLGGMLVTGIAVVVTLVKLL